jgi:hypothetical protein
LVLEKNVIFFAENCRKSHKYVIPGHLNFEGMAKFESRRNITSRSKAFHKTPGIRVTRFPDFSPIGLLWSVFWNLQNKPKFLGYFFDVKSSLSILSKNGLGYILDTFFRNSSDHPARPKPTFILSLKIFGWKGTSRITFQKTHNNKQKVLKTTSKLLHLHNVPILQYYNMNTYYNSYSI